MSRNGSLLRGIAIVLGALAPSLLGCSDETRPTDQNGANNPVADDDLGQLGVNAAELGTNLSSCTDKTAGGFASGTLTLTLGAGNTVVLGAPNGKITANGYQCVDSKGKALDNKTVTKMVVTGTDAGSEKVVLDMLGSTFGTTIFSDKGGLSIDLGIGQTDQFMIRGSAAADKYTLGEVSGEAMYGDLTGDKTADIKVVGAETLAASLGQGADTFTAGGSATVATFAGSKINLKALSTAITVFGGDGNDVIQGGDGNDILSGGAGDDVFKTAAIADGKDTYSGDANGVVGDTVDYSARVDTTQGITTDFGPSNAILTGTVNTSTTTSLYYAPGHTADLAGESVVFKVDGGAAVTATFGKNASSPTSYTDIVNTINNAWDASGQANHATPIATVPSNKLVLTSPTAVTGTVEVVSGTTVNGSSSLVDLGIAAAVYTPTTTGTASVITMSYFVDNVTVGSLDGMTLDITIDPSGAPTTIPTITFGAGAAGVTSIDAIVTKINTAVAAAGKGANFNAFRNPGTNLVDLGAVVVSARIEATGTANLLLTGSAGATTIPASNYNRRNLTSLVFYAPRTTSSLDSETVTVNVDNLPNFTATFGTLSAAPWDSTGILDAFNTTYHTKSGLSTDIAAIGSNKLVLTSSPVGGQFTVVASTKSGSGSDAATDLGIIGSGYPYTATPSADPDDGYGTEGDDIRYTVENVIGTSGDDSLKASAASNKLTGGAGNDTFVGGTGASSCASDVDILLGGDGDDTFTTATNDCGDTITGGNGNDTVNYGARSAALMISIDGVANDGEAGEKDNVDVEIIRGGTGADKIYGGAKDEIIYGGTGADLLFGGAGNDTIYPGPGADTVNGEAGDDLIMEPTADLLANTTDVINGGVGNDTVDFADALSTQPVTVSICLDATATGKLSGASSQVNDALGTYPGCGALFSGQDYVEMDATPGYLASGDQGLDIINVEAINGGLGNDTLVGSAATDTLTGNAGDDYIDGGAGDDVCYGNAGNDTLYGGDGDDFLDGGGGNDTINGGASTGLDTGSGDVCVADVADSAHVACEL